MVLCCYKSFRPYRMSLFIKVYKTGLRGMDMANGHGLIFILISTYARCPSCRQNNSRLWTLPSLSSPAPAPGTAGRRSPTSRNLPHRLVFISLYHVFHSVSLSISVSLSPSLSVRPSQSVSLSLSLSVCPSQSVSVFYLSFFLFAWLPLVTAERSLSVPVPDFLTLFIYLWHNWIEFVIIFFFLTHKKNGRIFGFL